MQIKKRAANQCSSIEAYASCTCINGVCSCFCGCYSCSCANRSAYETASIHDSLDNGGYSARSAESASNNGAVANQYANYN